MDPFGLPPFIKKPGLVLGPWDALSATMLWLKECYRENKYWRTLSRNLKSVRISSNHRSKLFRAFLLFGPFDGLNGLFSTDSYFRRIGVPYSRREVFGDLDSDRYSNYSPFAHPLESGWYTGIMNSALTISPSDIKRLVPSVSRILRKVGCKIITKEDYNKIEPSKRRVIVFKEEIYGQIEMIANGRFPFGVDRTFWPDYLEKPKVIHGHIDVAPLGLAPVQYVSNASISAVAALERSVITSTPLMSVDTAGPSWLSSSHVDDHLAILKIVFEEVGWLPQPRNFKEAWNMFNDDRMVSLREYIKYLFEMLTIGDVSQMGQIRNNIKEAVDPFKTKSWASKISKIVTYMAVPVSVAEVLLGNIGVGLGAGFIGTTSQFISDAITRSKQKSWLSIGRDFM